MNMLSKLKKKTTAADPVATDTLALDLLGDLQPLVNLVQPMRAMAAEHTRLLNALGQARFQQRHQKDQPLPEMTLDIQREIAVAMSNAEALAKFDAENGDALKAEIEAREKCLRERELLPARIAALEGLVQESARKTTTDIPITEIEDEAQKLFTPYAQRLLAAAKAYAKARSEAMSVAHVLNRAVTIRKYDVEGNFRVLAEPDLMADIAKGDILPNTMAGVHWEDLRDVNYLSRAYDDALLEQLSNVLIDAGVRGADLTVYQAKTDNDHRSFYAPEPVGPARPPETSPYSMPARVVIDVA